jgi:hypothetical protein
MLGSRFTDNQPVNPEISDASESNLTKFVESCVKASESHRNVFALMSGSYLDDAQKCIDLYNGKLYTKREKMAHECKPDDYAYYVDFDATLMKQYTYKEYVRQVDESGASANDGEALDALSMMRMLKFCHSQNRSEEKEEDMLRFRGMHGNGIYKFEPVIKDGLAWPGHDVIDPRHIGVSPGASDFADAVYYYYRRPVPTSELKEKYSDRAGRIKSDASVSFSGGGDTQGPKVTGGVGSSVVKFAMGLLGGSPESGLGEQTVLTEFYYKDPKVITINNERELDEWIERNTGFGTGEFKAKTKDQYMELLFPKALQPLSPDGIPVEPVASPFTVKEYYHGRVILHCNDIILDDYHNPLPMPGFVNCKCYRKPNEFWGKGIIHKIREPIQNKQMILAGNTFSLDYRLKPVYFLFGASGSAANLKKIPAEPNTVIQGGASGDIKALPTPNILPQDVLAASENRRRDAEMTAGLESVLGGVNQTGTYSGVQFEKQLEQATGKLAPRFRELNRARTNIGELYLWFIQNYMTDQRRLDFLTGAEEQDYLIINQQKSQGGQMVVENDVTKGKYHFFIDVSVNRPISVAERFKIAQGIAAIFEKVDPTEAAKIMLENMEVPGIHDYIRRFNLSVQKMQQSQQAMQQQQVAMAQQKQAQDASIKERDMDVKEVKAGSDVYEAQVNMVKELAMAGIKVPPQMLMNLGLTDSDLTMAVAQGDGAGE